MQAPSSAAITSKSCSPGEMRPPHFTADGDPAIDPVARRRKSVDTRPARHQSTGKQPTVPPARWHARCSTSMWLDHDGGHARRVMIALTKILVATDFGEAADAALNYGRALARRFGASLEVLHV